MGTNKEASCSLFLHNFLSQLSAFEKYLTGWKRFGMRVYVCACTQVYKRNYKDSKKEKQDLTVNTQQVKIHMLLHIFFIPRKDRQLKRRDISLHLPSSVKNAQRWQFILSKRHEREQNKCVYKPVYSFELT